MELSERIKALRKALGLKQDEFGVKIGTTRETVGKWERGEFATNTRTLDLIAEIFNVSPLWLREGKEPMFQEGRLPSPPKLSSGENIPAEKIRELGFTLIPRLTAAVGASKGGADNENIFIAEYLAFQTKWLLSLPYSTKSLHIVTVIGESMEPTYRNNDLVLVTTETRPTHQGVYILRDVWGENRIKRLKWEQSGTLHVISDNPDKGNYPDEEYSREQVEAGEVGIIGRVIWVCRNVG